MFISKNEFKELKKAETRAYLDGYNFGYEVGYKKALERKITPNMLREYLGLDPIHVVLEKIRSDEVEV